MTSQELRPYVALVDARKAKNSNSEAWSILQSRWVIVADAARATLQQYADGQVSQRAATQAAQHLCNVADSVDPWEVISTAIAMFLLQDQHPRRFTSDGAFDFQLVRRVLRLAPTNAGNYWDNKGGRSRMVYRDVPPRVIRTLAVSLKEAFGAPGLMLAAKEREDINKASVERLRLSKAMGDLE